MPKIRIAELSFRHPGFTEPLLDKISLDIDADWKTALIGRNGRGKTTLLKLIRGELTPDSGSIRREIDIQYYPYPILNPHLPALTVLKNALYPYDKVWSEMCRLMDQTDMKSLERYGDLEIEYRRMDGYDIEERIERESALMGIRESMLAQSFETLSPGEKTRLLITGLFMRDHIFPLIDEPTDHLDDHSRDKVAEYLSHKSGFICVSHDRRLLDLSCDHVVSLDRTGVSVTRGSYSQWEEQFERKLEEEERRYENIERSVKKLRKAANQRKDWSFNKESEKYSTAADKINNKGFIGHKAAKMMKQSLSVLQRLQNEVEQQEQLLVDKVKRYDLKFHPLTSNAGEWLMIENLSIHYGERYVVRNFNLILRSGERIALCGENGSGKSSVLKAITGEIEPAEGRIYINPGLTVRYASQVPRWRNGTIEDHYRQSGIDFESARSVLACLGIIRDINGKSYTDFSQGELKMIELSSSFILPAHFLIWDEPLNYLDISTRSRIETAILKYRPTLLFVEHDRYFIDKIATSEVRFSVNIPISGNSLP